MKLFAQRYPFPYSDDEHVVVVESGYGRSYNGDDHADTDEDWLIDTWHFQPAVIAAAANPDPAMWRPASPDRTGNEFEAEQLRLEGGDTTLWAVTVHPGSGEAWLGIGGHSRGLKRQPTPEAAEAAALEAMASDRAQWEWTGRLQPVVVHHAPGPGWAHWRQVPLRRDVLSGAVSLADPVGASEIAQRLGVTRGTVDQWRQRYSSFPPPTWPLAGGPVWDWPVVERWHTARSRG